MSLTAWSAIHKWTSLISTVFLLMVCVTGLPLIFGDEIGAWLNPPAHRAGGPSQASTVPLDRLVARSRAAFPGEIISSIGVDSEHPEITVWVAPSFKALNADPWIAHYMRFDARTGDLLERSRAIGTRAPSFIAVVRQIHINFFAGEPGKYWMALIGLLFVAAIVSGVVLYGPFTRKLDFGAVRTARTRRVRWLDLHNLLGVVTLAWALVVGVTGAMNELSNPLFGLWQRTDVARMLAPFHIQPPLDVQDGLSSPQAAVETAQRALPGMTVTGILFPGMKGGSPHHYLIWTKGKTALTARLFSPVLIDARTGKLTAVVRMPWYLRALEVSRPLHFGDYGGMPLKILWALLDVVTIVVLGSGLYLWIARPRRERAAARAQGLHGASPAMEPAE